MGNDDPGDFTGKGCSTIFWTILVGVIVVFILVNGESFQVGR